MFGISAFEAFIIICVAVIIFKPKDLVHIISLLGSFVAKIKVLMNNVSKEIEQIKVLSQLEDFVSISKNDNMSKDKENSDETYREK